MFKEIKDKKKVSNKTYKNQSKVDIINNKIIFRK